jgi:cytochrome P450
MSTATVGDLAYDHLDDPEAAHREIRIARERGPLAMGPHGLEVLSHDLVRAVLRDDRFTVPQGFSLGPQGVTSGPLWDRATSSLLCLDGAVHHRLRRLVAQAFTPKSAERMRGACLDVISTLLEAHLAEGCCDMVADVARPYPVPIICAMLGAPRQDWQRFSDWADNVLRLFSWDSAEHEEEILGAWAALDEHIDAMVADRREHLTDDLLSDLIRCEDAGDRLSHDELLMLAGGLLMAGTDTTRNQLAAAIEDLCDHPDQWRLLHDNPDLAPRAVQELIRHRPIVYGTVRVAVEDVELAGHSITAGTTVVANTASANRDAAVHDDPDRLDITREGAAPILTFGSGIHYCMGVHLAKVELVEALTAITARIAEPHRTARHPWRPLSGITGPTCLPIEFDAAAAA